MISGRHQTLDIAGAGAIDDHHAIAGYALRQGAFDYLSKPFKMAEVTVAVRRALEDQRLRDENRRLREEIARQYAVTNLLGRSRAMQSVFDQIAAVAGSEATVLRMGESGTGKELAARAIHFEHGRSHLAGRRATTRRSEPSAWGVRKYVWLSGIRPNVAEPAPVLINPYPWAAPRGLTPVGATPARSALP